MSVRTRRKGGQEEEKEEREEREGSRNVKQRSSGCDKDIQVVELKKNQRQH